MQFKFKIFGKIFITWSGNSIKSTIIFTLKKHLLIQLILNFLEQDQRDLFRAHFLVIIQI